MKRFVMVLMIALSGAFMSVAWLGHLRIKEYGFWIALALSWAIVLPEYVLNVAATRFGHGTFSGAQMGAVHLGSVRSQVTSDSAARAESRHYFAAIRKPSD